MKKVVSFILVAVVIVLGFNCEAQVTKKLDANEYQYIYTGKSTDTIGAGNTDWNMVITVNKLQALYYSHQVAIQRTSETGNYSVSVKGKKFKAETAFTNIATVVFYGSVADTIINLDESSNKKIYNYYEIEVVRNAGTAKVSSAKSFFRY